MHSSIRWAMVQHIQEATVYKPKTSRRGWDVASFCRLVVLICSAVVLQ